MYITIDNIFFYKFLWFFVIYIFVVIILVQFYVILVRNNMFHKKKHRSFDFGYHFLLCNRYRVSLLMKQTNKLLTHFNDATYRNYIFLAERGVQLDNGVTPRGFVGLTIFHMIFSIFSLNVGTLCGILPVQHYNVIDIFCFFLKNLLINQ